eukprot:s3244_g11.t1
MTTTTTRTTRTRTTSSTTTTTHMETTNRLPGDHQKTLQKPPGHHPGHHARDHQETSRHQNAVKLLPPNTGGFRTVARLPFLKYWRDSGGFRHTARMLFQLPNAAARQQAKSQHGD